MNPMLIRLGAKAAQMLVKRVVAAGGKVGEAGGLGQTLTNFQEVGAGLTDALASKRKGDATMAGTRDLPNSQKK